jgi:hypothetical protein
MPGYFRVNFRDYFAPGSKYTVTMCTSDNIADDYLTISHDSAEKWRDSAWNYEEGSFVLSNPGRVVAARQAARSLFGSKPEELQRARPGPVSLVPGSSWMN